jgi:hypothetical protein
MSKPMSMMTIEEIKANIIDWFKANKVKHATSYWITISSKGKWMVNYHTDYQYALSETEFTLAMGKKIYNK